MNNRLKGVLLIDDDEPTNFLHKHVLKRSDCTENIFVVNDGKEALEFLTCSGKYDYLESYPEIDLILLDINMPRMSGWDFLEEYKKLPEDHKGKIIIIMLTTSLNIQEREKAEEMKEISGFKNKSLTPDMIQEILNDHFNYRIE